MSGVGWCQSEMHPRTARKSKMLHFSSFPDLKFQISYKVNDLAIPIVVARFGGVLARIGDNPRFGPQSATHLGVYSGFWRLRHVSANSPKKEQRKWARLHLAIPVFVRSLDDNGKESLEFATAVNISAGGALVVVRRSLAKSSPISLEIPSAPIGSTDGSVRRSSRAIKARTIWVTHLHDYHLLGVKFLRPLSTNTAAVSRSQLRKASTAV